MAIAAYNEKTQAIHPSTYEYPNVAEKFPAHPQYIAMTINKKHLKM